MMLFRLIQGVAGAAMIPLSQAILMETFPPQEQQLVMAMGGRGLMVAPILGPTVGGGITDSWDWRWNFFINVPLGGVAFLMVSSFVHDPAYTRECRCGGPVDFLGMIYLAVALGLMQIIVDRDERADWFNSPSIVGAALMSFVATVLLVFCELRVADPIVELRFLEIRQFAGAVFAVVMLSFILFGTGILNPVFLQEFMGYTAWKAGLVMAPRACCAMIAMLFAGQVLSHGIDNKRLIGVAFVLQAIGLWSMAHWNLEVGIWQVIWPGMVLGLGLGMCSGALGRGADLRSARANGLCVESLQHDAQNRGRDGYRLPDQHAGAPSEHPSSVLGAAFFGLRSVADEQSRSASAGLADVPSARSDGHRTKAGSGDGLRRDPAAIGDARVR